MLKFGSGASDIDSDAISSIADSTSAKRASDSESPAGSSVGSSGGT